MAACVASLYLLGCSDGSSSSSASVEVPEITEERLVELINDNTKPQTNCFSWRDAGMWSDGIDGYLYHESGLYPDGINTIRDLMELDGFLVHQSKGVSELNPDYADRFTQTDGKSGSYISARPRLLDYSVKPASRYTAEFFAGEGADSTLMREVEYTFVYDPTELDILITQYNERHLKARPQVPETLPTYRDGFYAKYNPATSSWTLLDRNSALYPMSTGSSVPYECPYTLPR